MLNKKNCLKCCEMLKFPGKLQTYIGFTFVMHDQCPVKSKVNTHAFRVLAREDYG